MTQLFLFSDKDHWYKYITFAETKEEARDKVIAQLNRAISETPSHMKLNLIKMKFKIYWLANGLAKW